MGERYCGGCGRRVEVDEGERCPVCGMWGCVDCLDRLGCCWYCGDWLGASEGGDDDRLLDEYVPA